MLSSVEPMAARFGAYVTTLGLTARRRLSSARRRVPLRVRACALDASEGRFAVEAGPGAPFADHVEEVRGGRRPTTWCGSEASRAVEY